MTTAGLLQTCLLLGVFAPLASFGVLALFGGRLAGAPRRAGHDGHAPRAAGLLDAPPAAWVASAAIVLSLLCSLIALVVWAGTPADGRAGLAADAGSAALTWAWLGEVPIRFGVQLDSLTIIMCVMVTLCATCIHVFSAGYMAGDPGLPRFFAFLSLFCFSMLGLVVSRDLLFMFIFWELVGACSYFLIGFWFQRRSASTAAIKAFVVNRVGDFGFMVGLALCLIYLGTLSLAELPAVMEAGAARAGVLSGEPGEAALRVGSAQAERAAGLFGPGWLGVTLATWLGLGLFCGAVGKSAQFPLHVWLPDAMEGPTPVSALIHAATMVAAGVYLVARVYPLLTPEALMVIAVVGCITLTIAAAMALVQTDIKRVLAYSTLSQLGYMVLGLGIGAWTAALFHLLTHAFFKALLFLGAGQVIAGCHHEQDMRRMGGLLSRMPTTAWTFLVAVLAISGFGIPWTPLGVGGFYSKDEILAVAHYRAFHADPSAAHHAAIEAPRVLLVADPPVGAAAHAPAQAVTALPAWLFLLPLIVAYLTPLYMGRCFVLTFLGRPRDPHLHQHAHESPIMYTPLLVLAFMTVVSGWFLFRAYVAYAAPAATPLAPILDAHHGHDAGWHATHAQLPLLVGFAWVIGLGGAWLLYRNGLDAAQRLARLPLLAGLHALASAKFYFDEVYNALLVGGTKALAVAARLFDNIVVDGIVNTLGYAAERISRFAGVVLDNLGVDGLVDGVARLFAAVGSALRAAHTGLVRNYVLLAALSALSLVLGMWSAPVGLAAALAGVSLLAGSVVLLVVLGTGLAIAGGLSGGAPAAWLLLAAAVLALMALGRRRPTPGEAAEMNLERPAVPRQS